MPITLIWAESKNGIIGNKDKLPWHIPEELKHFKSVTENKTIVFGINTFKGFGGRVLPNRTTVVLNTRGTYDFGEIFGQVKIGDFKNIKVMTVPEVLELAKDKEVIIAGGRKTYELFMPQADKIIRTVIDLKVDGDTKAPKFKKKNFWLMNNTEHNGWTVKEYKRKEYLYVKVRLLTGESYLYQMPNDINPLMVTEYKSNPEVVKSTLLGSLINVPLTEYRNDKVKLGVGLVERVFVRKKPIYWRTRGQFITKDRYQTLKEVRECFSYMAHDHSFVNKLRIKRDLLKWCFKHGKQSSDTKPSMKKNQKQKT